MADDKVTDENENASFGDWLKTQRTDKGISLEEIAAVTKIHIVQLQNIENDKIDDLPSMAFVRGFLVNYARHLDLEENDVLQRFKTFSKIEGSLSQFMKKKEITPYPPTHVGVAQTPQLSKAPGVDFRKKNSNRFNIKKKHVVPVLIIALLVGTLSLLVSLGSKDADTSGSSEEITSNSGPQLPPEAEAPLSDEELEGIEPEAANIVEEKPKAAPPPPVEKKIVEKPTPPPAALPAATVPVPTTTGKLSTLEIRGLEASWIKVRVDEKNPEGVQLETDAKNRYSVKNKVVLSLSNAGAVEIKWNNQWYESPGFRGDVKSITLPDQLDTLKKKTP